jgi:hypothetical protein
VLLGVAFGDGHNSLFAQAPIDGNLRGGFANHARKFVKKAAGITILDAIEAPRERTVSNHGYVISLTVWQEVFLDGSINEVISNLIGYDGVRAKRTLGLLELCNREIANADKPHLPRIH